jgi:hypothetical protein
MWKVLGNVIEMFVYSAIYIIITLVAVKIVGATFTSDLEKKVSEEANLALSIICAALLIGLAILLSSIVR